MQPQIPLEHRMIYNTNSETPEIFIKTVVVFIKKISEISWGDSPEWGKINIHKK